METSEIVDTDIKAIKAHVHMYMYVYVTNLCIAVY